MNRPDVDEIVRQSYACGLPAHWKTVRLMADYIAYLERKLKEFA